MLVCAKQEFLTCFEPSPSDPQISDTTAAVKTPPFGFRKGVFDRQKDGNH